MHKGTTAQQTNWWPRAQASGSSWVLGSFRLQPAPHSPRRRWPKQPSPLYFRWLSPLRLAALSTPPRCSLHSAWLLALFSAPCRPPPEVSGNPLLHSPVCCPFSAGHSLLRRPTSPPLATPLALPGHEHPAAFAAKPNCCKHCCWPSVVLPPSSAAAASAAAAAAASALASLSHVEVIGAALLTAIVATVAATVAAALATAAAATVTAAGA